jgi:pyruvate/2-oxoglutarate dehydrogenase complex dihydrolipoamide acyltransferase (E2) component
VDKIGNYQIKPFSVERKNIELVLKEGWRKHSIHAILEFDVTNALEKIKKIQNEKNVKISFTGWIIKCISQGLTEYKDLNSYRLGNSKYVLFDDVDIAIPVERKINDEYRPRAYIIRKANEKNIYEITKEIRAVQNQEIDYSTQVLGENLTRFEKSVLNAPIFLKKIVLKIARKKGLMRKKHTGTIGVTSIGMKGKFPGGIIPLGGTATLLFVLGGIIKKPGVINDKIEIREFLNMTITADHDLIDGGPLTRFVERLNDLIENAFELNKL